MAFAIRATLWMYMYVCVFESSRDAPNRIRYQFQMDEKDTRRELLTVTYLLYGKDMQFIYDMSHLASRFTSQVLDWQKRHIFGLK